jgi:hypothetical protein
MDVTPYIGNISHYFDNFAAALQADSPAKVLSIHVTGSVLTPDFVPDRSDINSIVVVDEITLPFLDAVVQLGQEYSQHFIGAPLLMTPSYIATSLDVFPIEFLNFKAIHHTVYGGDVLEDLLIDRTLLRLQCERELKSKLLWLHQGYIETLGDEQKLNQRLSRSITGFIPLFRAILYLGGRNLRLSGREAATSVSELAGIEQPIFTAIWQLKQTDSPPADKEFCDCFAEYYRATQHLVAYVEDLAL